METKILGPIGGNSGGDSNLLAGALIGSLANGNNCNGNNCNGGLLGGNGWGAGLIGFFLGALLNNGGNGFGLFGGGNDRQNAQLAQDFLTQAIESTGQRQTDALQNLANSLNTSFDQVYTTFMSVKDQLATMAGDYKLGQCQTQGTIERTGNDIINAGNQSTREITALLNQQFSQQQQSDCQFRHDIIDAINANGRAAIAKMDAIEDARKDRELAEANRKLAQCENEKFIMGYVGQSLAPILGTLTALGKQVDGIACKLPQTVTLPYNNLTAVPNWQAQIAYDIAGSAIANRLFPSQADATATAGAGGAA